MNQRERDWAQWLRAAEKGDGVAYRRLLSELAGFIRAVVRSRSALGLAAADVEDVVQETLLAIHLKRGTWDPGQPVAPWVAAIARNKMVDALRRRGRRVEIPVDDFAEILPAPQDEEHLSPRETEKLLSALKGRQHEIVRAITMDGDEVADVAKRLDMSAGAVRVALHRGLKALAETYRSFRE